MSAAVNSIPLNTEIDTYIKNHIRFFTDGMMFYTDVECTLPVVYKEVEDEILNLEVLPDDVWVITYPKCGTTWTQEMVWMIVNDFNYEGAKSSLIGRFPFLEFVGLDKDWNKIFGISSDDPLRHVKALKPPRLIKSHLPVGLLPRQLTEVNPKIIYLLREPKDVAVSYLNHYRIIDGYNGTKERFFEAFMSNSLLYGSYWGNVAPFWKLRHQPNVLINTFEEMKKDLPAVIRRTAEFLGKSSLLENEIDKFIEHLKFSNMKNNDFVNWKPVTDVTTNFHGESKNTHFMNKGKVGNYKEEMSPEWIKRFNYWIQAEKIKHGILDEEFPY